MSKFFLGSRRQSRRPCFCGGESKRNENRSKENLLSDTLFLFFQFQNTGLGGFFSYRKTAKQHPSIHLPNINVDVEMNDDGLCCSAFPPFSKVHIVSVVVASFFRNHPIPTTFQPLKFNEGRRRKGWKGIWWKKSGEVVAFFRWMDGNERVGRLERVYFFTQLNCRCCFVVLLVSSCFCLSVCWFFFCCWFSS